MSDPLNADVIVLGAGMVGASTALHLQKRGRSVVLVDRRGAGEETSYGNTGIIQREGVVPYPFPRDIGLMAQYALNMRPEANLHWSALPKHRAVALPLLAGLHARRARRLLARGAAAGGALHRRARGADGGCGHPRHAPAHGLPALPSLGGGARGRARRGPGQPAGLRRQLPSAQPGRAGRGRAAPAGSEGRRHPDARARQRGRPGRGREGLRAAVGGARRAVRGGRCAHAVEAARRLAGAHRQGADHGRRGGGGAGAVVGRSLPHARAVVPVRRQARLSHALHGRRATRR